MAVLPDSSAWIEFFHPRGDPDVKRQMAEIIERDEVATVAPVVAELLVGARTVSERQAIERGLSLLRLLPLGWPEAAVAAGLGQTLERRGLRVPLVDLLIAAAARQGLYDVWHAGDQDYDAIARLGGIRVVNLRRVPPRGGNGPRTAAPRSCYACRREVSAPRTAAPRRARS